MSMSYLPQTGYLIFVQWAPEIIAPPPPLCMESHEYSVTTSSELHAAQVLMFAHVLVRHLRTLVTIVYGV
jgi:hypothetical protein